MHGLIFGKGLDDEAYENMVDALLKKLDEIAAAFFERSFAVLIKYAKLIAQCSRWQYMRLRDHLGGIRFGRVRQVGDILAKVQLFGAGRMALHVAKNGGITAQTFVRLTKEEQNRLNTGEVLFRWRGDVVSIRTVKLTDKQMAVIVRSCHAVGGAKILTPDEQSQPRPRRVPRFYGVDGMQSDGDTIVVTSKLGRSVHKTRFTVDDIRQFITLGRAVMRRSGAG